MKQRVSLALSLLGRPPFLLLDEVTSALDLLNQQRVVSMCQDIRERLGTGLLMTTHSFAFLEQAARQVAVLKDGVLVEQGPTEQVLRAPRHPYTRQLLAAAPPRRGGAAP